MHPHAPGALRQTVRPWLWRYGLAVAAVAAALLLRLALGRLLGEETPFLLQFAAVLVAAGFGGLGPGILATLLGALASSLLFLSPRFQFRFTDAPDTLRLLLFLGEGLFISVLGARLQIARQRAEQSEAQTRQLEQRILDISEEERRRIGQDLHDGLGQQLTGVAFLSKALQQRLAAKGLPEAADATSIARLVSESIGQTRALARGLAPVGLEHGDLAAALTQLASATSSVFGVECDCRCDEQVLLSNLAVATHLYRIAQEAVNNAIRHGKAARIVIGLEVASSTGPDGRLRLWIEDDGIGIDSPPGQLRRADDARDGLGLQIMSFRAKMIGAELQIRRRAGGGTIVTCSAPYPPPTPPEQPCQSE